MVMKKWLAAALLGVLTLNTAGAVPVMDDAPPSAYLHATNISGTADDSPPSGYVHITNFGGGAGGAFMFNDGSNATAAAFGAILSASSTPISATGKTVSGLTLSSPTLSGTTTLPGSGQISSAGSLGLGGTPAAQLHLQGNLSASAWTTNGLRLRVDAATLTDTSSSGTVAEVAANSIRSPTFSASSTTTYTQAETLRLGPPIAGTNVTITNPLTLYVASGASLFNGNILITGSTIPLEIHDLTSATAGNGLRFGGSGTTNWGNLRVPISGAGAIVFDTWTGSVWNSGVLSLTAGGGVAVGSSVEPGVGNLLVNGNVLVAGVTSSFPMLKRSGMTLQVRLADDSADAPISASTATFSAVASDIATADATACIRASDGLLLKGTGTLGICLGTSSAKFKHDIAPAVDGLAQIAALRPVSFLYNKGYGDDGIRQQFGFLAEDVINTLPKLVGLDLQGRPNSVDMLGMVPAIVKAIQEQQVEIDELKKGKRL